MTTSRHARSGLLWVPVIMLAGCGSAEDAPAPAPAPRPAARPAPQLLASYAGTWTRDDGAVFEVTDEAGAVKGSLTSDPSGRWRSVEFTLDREQDALRGVATVALLEPEAQLEVRWELLPAEGGALSGRLQTAWVDDQGQVVLFADDPEWRTHRFDVVPPAAPEPAPAVAEEPAEPEPAPVEPTEPTEPEPTVAEQPVEPEPAPSEEPVAPEPTVAEAPDEPAVEPEPSDTEPTEPAPAVVEEPAGPSADELARAEAEAARRAAEEEQAQLALAAVDAEEARLDEELEAARERWASERAARVEAGRARRDARLRREAEEQARREAEEQARREAEEQARREAEAQAQAQASATETTPGETTPGETTSSETTPSGAGPSESTPSETTPDETSPSEAGPSETGPAESPEEQAQREEAERRAAEEQARRDAEEAARRRAQEEERTRALAGGAPDPEEARRLAEEQARRDAEALERQKKLDAIRERRSKPEGLAQVLFEAMKGLDGELFAACWIDAQDAQHLFGARGMEQAQLVRRARNDAWNSHRRESVHAELQRATFVRADVPTRSGHKGPEVQNGQIVYRVDGEERTIPLAHLYQVADGSWKAARMLP